MRISTIALLAFATILVNPAVGHFQQGSISKTSANPPDVFTTDENVATPTRKLFRSNPAVNNDESDSDDRAQVEERALPGLSKIAELASKLGSFQELSNRLWLKARENPTSVFKMLNLGKAGGKLDDNPKFLQWLHYVKSYQSKGHSFPDNSVYFLLRDHMSEAKVATLLQSLKQVPDLKLLAKNVEIAQFEHWYSLRKHPDGVAEVLGVENGLSTLSSSDPRYEILVGYTILFTRFALSGIR
ncbi:hypothetical protein PRNP1_014403 [Phytophthora ramorum]